MVKRVEYEDVVDHASELGDVQTKFKASLTMDNLEFVTVFESLQVQKNDPQADPQLKRIIEGLQFTFSKEPQ